jgi:hypothetical protein
MIHIPASKLMLMCESDAEQLRRLRKIQNEILINCAYHEKNKESQIAKMKQSGASKEEIKMVVRTYDLQEKFGLRLMGRFERLIEQLEYDIHETTLET